MNRFLLLAFLCCWSIPVRAQTTPPELQAKVPVKAATTEFSPELKEIRRLYRIGLNRELIEKATLSINKNDKPDPALLYWRGYARKRLGLFDDARKDLQPLGDFTGWPKFPTAAQLTTELDTLLQLRPPHQ
jgi:hypothetical protein